MFFLSKVPLFLLLLISLNLAAQDVKVDWGPENDDGDNKAINFPIGWQGDYYYNLRMDYKIMTNKYDAYLEKVDKNMKVVSVKELAYESNVRIKFDYMQAAEGKFYLFSSTFQGSEDKLDLYYNAFDLNGRPVGTEVIAQLPVDKFKNHNIVKYSLSSDKKTLAAVHSYGGFKKDPLYYQAVKINVENPSEAVIINGQLPSPGYSIAIEGQQVNNEGLISMIVVRQNEKKGEEDASLMVIESESNIRNVDVSYQDYILDNFSMIEDKKGDLKLAGVYKSKEKRKSFYEGFFIASFDPASGEISDFHNKPFDSKLIAKYGKKAMKNGNTAVSGKYHTKIYPSQNGGGYVVAENLTIVDGEYRTYYYGELLILGYNADGEFTFADLIPKFQADRYRPPRTSLVVVAITWDAPLGIKKLMESYTTYHAINHKGNLYLMYNDDEDNANVKNMDDVDRLDNPYKSKTRLIVVGPDGNIDRKALFDNKSIGGYFSSSKCYEEKAPYVVGVKKRKSQRFGILEFED
jgi:hypothetical protein